MNPDEITADISEPMYLDSVFRIYKQNIRIYATVCWHEWQDLDELHIVWESHQVRKLV